MNSQWNTRKFSKKLGTSLCQILKEISVEDQILVVQPEVLPILNALLTFTQLTDSTPVRKIVVLGNQSHNDISDILDSIASVKLVFLIDIRLDLTIPSQLVHLVKSLGIANMNIVFCTWKSQRSNNLLENGSGEAGALSHFIISQLADTTIAQLLPWYMLPIPQIDDDVLLCNLLYNSARINMYSPATFSMHTATREMLLDNMINCLQDLIEETQSTITHTVSIGDESKKLVRLLRQRAEAKEDAEDVFIKETLYGDKYSGLETDLIVIERDMDPLTPLLTQLTYAGLLDDLHELTSDGKLKDTESTTLKYLNDEIWDDLKFLNFGALGPRLNQIARDLQNSYDARHKAESVGEIKQFVESLASLQERQKLLKMHTTLSSDVLQEVETNDSLQFNRILELEQDLLLGNLDNKNSCDSILDLVYEGQTDVNRVLRLLCLSSLCKNGLRDKDYEIIKRNLIDTYGIEICFQLERLTLSGLFTCKSFLTNQFSASWKKEYRYISTWLDTLPPIEDDEAGKTELVGNNDASRPRDATFAYCGMVPLSIRLIQLLYDRSVLSKSYSSQQPFIISREPSALKTEELFEQIYGRSGMVQQENWMPTVRKNKKRVTVGQVDYKTNDIAIVVFLGGVTLGEIATLKFLQNKLREKDINKRFIVVSDGLINGNRIIESSVSHIKLSK